MTRAVRGHRRKKKITARERLGIPRELWVVLTPRDRYLRAKYGLTERQYDAMVVDQDGACHICGWLPKPGRRHHVDHDHRTKRVRGVLCFRCNHRLLGCGLEDAKLHAAAARYLERVYDGRRL